MILQGKNIVLGVTGGIAAYKAVDLCSKLVQAGAHVDVIMTEAALAFVTPLPFQTITQRPVSTDMFRLLDSTDMAHISLAKKADLVVIAPATANTISKLATGLADNLLTTTVLATTAPLVLAPAMDADMWAHAATLANVRTLEARGAVIIPPEEGRLASGRIGRGRLPATETILAAIRQTLGGRGPLAGMRVLITAGGTQEPLDPVRHLTNRSSGRMGYALAEAARDLGATVTLISAPTALGRVYGVRQVAVRTAEEMAVAVLGHRDVGGQRGNAEAAQVEVLLVAQVGDGEAADRLEVVRVARGHDRLHVRRAGRFAREIGLRDVGDVGAPIAVGGEVRVVRPDRTRARLHRQGQVADLRAGVVVVELARHAPAGGLEQRAERIAERGLPAVADVQRPGWVGRDELDQHLARAAGVRRPPAEGRPFREHPRHHRPSRLRRQAKIDESGPGHLGRLEQATAIGREQGVADRLGEIARLASRHARELQRDVRREIAVLGLLRPVELDLRQLGRGIAERAGRRLAHEGRQRLFLFT